MENEDLFKKVNNEEKPIVALGIKDFSLYYENPSLPRGLKQIRIVNESVTTIVHKPDGTENKETKGFPSFRFVDEKPFVNVYDEWFKSEEKLSNSGMRVFRWICKHLPKDHDEVSLSPMMISKDLGYKTPKPVHDGILELLKLDAIYKKIGKQPIYFININLFFRGKRGNLPIAKKQLTKTVAEKEKESNKKPKDK